LDSFGKTGPLLFKEQLIRNASRNATINAASPLKLAMLDAKKFKELRLGEKLSFAKRKAIQTFDRAADPAAEKGDVTKTEEDVRRCFVHWFVTVRWASYTLLPSAFYSIK
jgi:hypothetical protein